MVDHLEQQFQALGAQDAVTPDYPDQDHVLIIEDDQRLAELTREYLEANGFQVTLEADGAKGVDRILTLQPDLVILDLMLPGEDGLAICRRVRPNFAGPIMMLTARTDDLDQVLGLEMGADDYVPKPVQPRVLLARMRALLRRADAPAPGSEMRLRFENLEIDNATREAWLFGERIDLTSAEFDLLWLLASNAGRVLTREEIFNELRGIKYDGQDRSIDVRVSRIRPKVGDDPHQPHRIKTVRSKGYLFVKDS
ncbi:response regulator [Vreelandella andesensis]|uniref:Response regulator n=1 Tax=Vreelandella andesensis TaxID=447567 RepID=A0A433KZC0_9GAMM|nr:winged helix-turn-helix domain-containing protein [Halomonas andesensis]RUR34981.1 response regulator [Halomonas andesensis]